MLGCGMVPRDPARSAPALSQVPPFSTSPPDGDLPAGWKPFVLRRDKGTTRYRTVKSDGRTVLSARAESTSTAIQCEVDIDLAKRRGCSGSGVSTR